MDHQPPMPSWATHPIASPPLPPDDRVPTGIHDVVVVDSCERHWPQGVPYFFFTYMIIGTSSLAGRKIEDVFRCKDPNLHVRDDEYLRLSMLCHAVEVLTLNMSSSELYGRPFQISVMTVGRQTIVQGYASKRAGTLAMLAPGVPY